MDHLDSLKVFVAVADSRGFAAAARRLRQSAPAVTRAIAALEQRLGVQLLQRSTRSVRLTDVGQRFLDDCRRILADLDEAEASAGGAHGAPRGARSITAPAMFGRLHVAPIALEFLRRHPQVSIRAVFVDRVVHLLDEGFDLALRIAPLPDSGLTALRVGALRRVVVAAPAYLAEHGTPGSPAELGGFDAVGFALNDGAMPPWAFGMRGGVAPRIGLVSNSSEVAIDAAIAGHGLARCLHYQVDAAVRDGRLQIILAEFEPEPTPVHLVHVAGRMAPARLRAFIDFAAERLRAEPVLNPARADAISSARE